MTQPFIAQQDDGVSISSQNHGISVFDHVVYLTGSTVSTRQASWGTARFGEVTILGASTGGTPYYSRQALYIEEV